MDRLARLLMDYFRMQLLLGVVNDLAVLIMNWEVTAANCLLDFTAALTAAGRSYEGGDGEMKASITSRVDAHERFWLRENHLKRFD